MIESLLPTTLTGAARRLGVEPLEVVRLMVVSDSVSPGFKVSEEELGRLAALGRMEWGWWDGFALPDDPQPLRQRVRGALQLLISRGATGPIRMDNLWRGLPPDDQRLIEDALNVLADEELLVIQNAVPGVQVHISSGKTDVIQGIADGTVESPGLTDLYAGE